MGSSNLVIHPGPSRSSGNGEGSRAANQGNSDMSGMERSNGIASAGQTEDIIGSNSSASHRGLPQVTQGKHRGTPQLGSTIRFSHQGESHLVSGGENPEVLSDADHAFLLKHIRKGTTTTYGSGWHWFQRFCQGYGINRQLAPLPLIVKFI